MQNKKNELQIIKEKAAFVYKYSGIISDKIYNPITKEDTINNLERLLFSCDSIEQCNDLCNKLKNKSNIRSNSKASYYNSINIIFVIAQFINRAPISNCELEEFKNKLRQYPKHFKLDEKDDLRLNGNFVAMDYEQAKILIKKK
ncbi:MAG: hypothetical protein PHN42_05910 [Bacilli bacterium]|nr:hypothetical protein [Bacilli bacterium]